MSNISSSYHRCRFHLRVPRSPNLSAALPLCWFDASEEWADHQSQFSGIVTMYVLLWQLSCWGQLQAFLLLLSALVWVLCRCVWHFKSAGHFLRRGCVSGCVLACVRIYRSWFRTVVFYRLAASSNMCRILLSLPLVTSIQHQTPLNVPFLSLFLSLSLSPASITFHFKLQFSQTSGDATSKAVWKNESRELLLPL